MMTRYLKILFIGCISLGMVFFPANIIGCGPSEDPYDYYTSFFSNRLSGDPSYRPYCYTGLLTFYDHWEDAPPKKLSEDVLIQEWKTYFNNRFGLNDVSDFIYGSTAADLEFLVTGKRNPNPRPPKKDKDRAFERALLTDTAAGGTGLKVQDLDDVILKYLEKNPDREAASYLWLAKKTESLSASADGWSLPEKINQAEIASLIAEAEAGRKSATRDYFKEKFAYQLCKLAFYSSRFSDCVNWCDAYFKTDTKSVVRFMAQSYKAGSLYRLKKFKEAAHQFSRLFVTDSYRRRDHYLGFFWSVQNSGLDQQAHLAACANQQEAMEMLAMFSLWGSAYRTDDIEKIFQQIPQSPMLAALATREINKLEEHYLTARLRKENGGKSFYYYWEDTEKKDESNRHYAAAVATRKLLEKIARSGKNNPAFFQLAAAYSAFMVKDYEPATQMLNQAKGMPMTEAMKNQWNLINLLIAANSGARLDAALEAQLLPSLQWAVEMAKKDPEYQKFIRNLFSEIIAQRYEQQGEIEKATLVYGLADRISYPDGEYCFGNGLEYLRQQLSGRQVLNLYNLQTKENKTGYEKFLTTASGLQRSHSVDMLGTAYLRERDYPKAIEWLKKLDKQEPLLYEGWDYQTRKEVSWPVDPFYDYVNDYQRNEKKSAVAYNKLTYAIRMQELIQQAAAAKNKEEKSKLCYLLGNAMYNQSYYGNSWDLVAYGRGSTEWNTGRYKTEWEKEYFGVHKAREYFQQAYELTANKEFKAACFFLVLKCGQRQVPKPEYDYRGGDEAYKNYEVMEAVFDRKFRNNTLFPAFVKEFGGTKYYKYVYNRCSYLRDFVKAGKVK